MRVCKYIIDNEKTLGILRNYSGWMEDIYHINIECERIEIFTKHKVDEGIVCRNHLIFVDQVTLY